MTSFESHVYVKDVGEILQESLRLINFYFKWLLNKALKHPRFNVALCLTIFAIFGYFAQNLSQIVSIEDQLDPGMRSTQELKRTKELFGAETSLGFIIEPRGAAFKLNDLCVIQKAVNDIVLASPQVEGFISPYKIRQAVVTADKLSYMRVLPNPCEGGSYEGNPLSKLKESPWNAVVTDHQARDFAVSLRMRDLEVPGRYGTFDPAGVENVIHAVQEKIPYQVWFTGTSAQQLFTMKGMAQSQVLNILVVLIIGIGFRILFGTWRSGMMFLGTLFFSATVVFGTMGLLGYAVDPLSSCLFLMIAVASLEDFIFISYYHMKSQGSYKRSFRNMITPSFFTSLTTMLGFGSLMISDLQSIRRFGGLATLGAFVEWICVFLILPSFMILFPKLQLWVNQRKAKFYGGTERIVKKTPPRWLVVASLAVFVGAGFSVKNFRLSQTPSEIFPADHPFQQGMEYIKKTRGWVADASLVFEPHLRNEKKFEILKAVSADPLVVKMESYPQVEDYVAQNIRKPSLTRDLVSFELKYSGFYDRYNASGGENRVVLYLQTTNTEKLNKLREKVDQLCPEKECWLAGEFVGFADFSKALIQTLFDSLFLSLILVAGVVFYLTRALNKKHFVSVMLSALWGPAWMLVAIYVFDLSVNFVTCIVASTLIGLTGDNAIQYMFGAEDLKDGIESRGVGSLQCAVIMALCCLAFLVSYFEPPRMLGILLAGGFVVSLFGDLWVLKGLIRKR